MSATTHDEHALDAAELMDDPEAGSSWFITIASIVILIVLLVALAVLFFRAENAEFEKKVVDRASEPLMDLRNAQNLLLSESGEYTDPDTGEVRRRIPIHAAMEQVATEYGAR